MTTCRHCGAAIYEAPTTYTERTVKGRPFSAPLRRNWWHSGTAEEVVTASRAANVAPHHKAEP